MFMYVFVTFPNCIRSAEVVGAAADGPPRERHRSGHTLLPQVRTSRETISCGPQLLGLFLQLGNRHLASRPKADICPTGHQLCLVRKKQQPLLTTLLGRPSLLGSGWRLLSFGDSSFLARYLTSWRVAPLLWCDVRLTDAVKTRPTSDRRSFQTLKACKEYTADRWRCFARSIDNFFGVEV